MTKALQQRIESLEERVNELSEVLNEIIARNIPLYAILDADEPADLNVPNRFELDFGAGDLVIRNSYAAERYKGSSLRWLGPDPISNIPVPLDRCVNYHGIVHVAHKALGDDDLKDVIVEIDGERVDAQMNLAEQPTISFDVPAAHGSVRMPSFILTISFPKASDPIPSDSRPRTIAVSKIEFVRNG